mgnify:CR=1 FL=1
MSVTKFDEIDIHILRELQDDGRMTNVDLAQRVGLTAPPCLRRVRALEDSGVIRSYHAELDASQLGFGITVFAMVSLRSQAESDLEAFETILAWRGEGLPALLLCSGSDEESALASMADLVVDGPDGVLAFLNRLARDLS